MNNQATKETKQKNGGFTMVKNIRKQLKNEKGLTLVELLAVIVILAIIAAIAVPAIGNLITNSKYNAVKADALNVLNAGQMYYLDTPEGDSEEDGDTTSSVKVSQLKDLGYLETAGAIPEDASVSIGTPHKLDTVEITFATGKTVQFTDATIEDINGNNTKGSQVEDTEPIGGN